MQLREADLISSVKNLIISKAVDCFREAESYETCNARHLKHQYRAQSSSLDVSDYVQLTFPEYDSDSH